MKRIGLLGGSFNPAHRGHRNLSLHALRALGLDEVWWLVSPGNPMRFIARRDASARARAQEEVHYQGKVNRHPGLAPGSRSSSASTEKRDPGSSPG